LGLLSVLLLQETTTAPAEPAATAIVRENVEAGSFDLRVLDCFVTDHYYYTTDPYFDDVQDAFSQAGKFVVDPSLDKDARV
jgi:hypothetical protein